jgi:hypothetical protein
VELGSPVAALDEAMLERRTFRQVLVGALRYPPKRLTWVFFRSATRARLQVLCQLGKPPSQLGISLTGTENEPTSWRPPTLTVYTGARAGEGSLRYRLSAVSGPVGETGCEVLPGALELACRPEQVAVLPAGATLIPGKKMADDRMTPARWQPSTRERLVSLRCDLSVEGDVATWPFRHVQREWPLVFVSPREGAPGIEWAHENSDQVVQEGAYRWMPAPE